MIKSQLMEKFKKIKQASSKLAILSHASRKKILVDFLNQLKRHKKQILWANQKDLKNFYGEQAIKERLELDDKKIKQIILSNSEVVNLPDALNEVRQTIKRPNGLVIKQVSMPFGVVAAIYESRPNVTVDLAILAIKTGNAIILKGGKESFKTNKYLVSLIHKSLKKNGLPSDLVFLIDPSSDWKQDLLNAHGTVDVLIPRGSQNLIEFVRQNAKIPIIETGAGVCHTFVDEFYSVKNAVDIIVNAKTQRPSVCNSLDTLVIHGKMSKKLLPVLAALLSLHKVEVFADHSAFAILKNFYPKQLLKVSKTEDYGREFLSLKMSIKTVINFEEGLEFIKRHTSGHSEAILTDNKKHAREFLQEVDAAAVYHNASTRFTDGGEFGMGSEVGISTQKLHARGPMGIKALTSYKWIVLGKGQVRV